MGSRASVHGRHLDRQYDTCGIISSPFVSLEYRHGRPACLPARALRAARQGLQQRSAVPEHALRRCRGRRPRPRDAARLDACRDSRRARARCRGADAALLPAAHHAPSRRLDEAFANRSGRQAALDRLCELLVIQLLRHLMDGDPGRRGLLAGLADPRLAKALNAMHNEPARDWSLESLARRAGMSRARFAVNFRETLGTTPGDYLAQWRLGLAQSLLRKDRPVSVVASEVGYSGAAALTRAFRARFGKTPSAWRN